MAATPDRRTGWTKKVYGAGRPNDRESSSEGEETIMATSVYAETSSQEHGTPGRLAGYLDRIGKERLLTPREERELSRCARAEDEARGELEKLRARRQMITRAQSDMEELVESYAEALPDDLACLTGSERHGVYRVLSLRLTLDNSGIVELGGVLAVPQDRDHIETCPET